MHHSTSKALFSLLDQYSKHDGSFVHEVLRPTKGSLQDFHQWANGKTAHGAALVKYKSFPPLWLTFIEWNAPENFYLILFSENRKRPLAEIHKSEVTNGEVNLRWAYSPTLRDGRNDERRAYFVEHFLSLEVSISVPKLEEELTEFFDEVFALVQTREKADCLHPEPPPVRDSFQEGKLFSSLHQSRERDPELIRLAKARALHRTGKLACECCGFDFELVYGPVGKGFIEGHHTIPVSTLSRHGEPVRVEDIALVCANCHRMLHLRRPWLEMHQLKELLS